MFNIEIDFGNDGYKLTAKVKQDGDKWCVGVGEDLMDGPHGFGSSIDSAITDFKSEFRNARVPEIFPGTLDKLSSL